MWQSLAMLSATSSGESLSHFSSVQRVPPDKEPSIFTENFDKKGQTHSLLQPNYKRINGG
jgi:hypothetical protein